MFLCVTQEGFEFFKKVWYPTMKKFRSNGPTVRGFISVRIIRFEKPNFRNQTVTTELHTSVLVTADVRLHGPKVWFDKRNDKCDMRNTQRSRFIIMTDFFHFATAVLSKNDVSLCIYCSPSAFVLILATRKKWISRHNLLSEKYSFPNICHKIFRF